MNTQTIGRRLEAWSAGALLGLKELASQTYLNKIAYIVKSFLAIQSERVGHPVAPALHKAAKAYANVTDVMWFLRVFKPLRYPISSDTIINQRILVQEIIGVINPLCGPGIRCPEFIIEKIVRKVLEKNHANKQEFLMAVQTHIQDKAEIIIDQINRFHNENQKLVAFYGNATVNLQNIDLQNIQVETSSFLDILSRIFYAITSVSIVVLQFHEWGIYNLSKISETIGLNRVFGYIREKVGIALTAPKIFEGTIIGSLLVANICSLGDTIYRIVKSTDGLERRNLIIWDIYAAASNIILYGAFVVFNYTVVNYITIIVRTADIFMGATRPASLF